MDTELFRIIVNNVKQLSGEALVIENMRITNAFRITISSPGTAAGRGCVRRG